MIKFIYKTTSSTVINAFVFASAVFFICPVVEGTPVAEKQNFAQFWAEKIMLAKGDVFLHSTFRPQVTASKETLVKIRAALKSELSKAVKSGELKLDSGKTLNLSIKVTHGYTKAVMSEDILREYSVRAIQGYKEFLDYVERPDLLPKIKFELLDDKTVFKSPTTNAATMYLAWDRKQYFTGRAYYRGETNCVYAARFLQRDASRGQLVGSFHGSVKPGEGVTLTSIPHHAYGGVGYSAISSFAMPISEMFPLFLRHIAAAHVSDEINTAWKLAGSPKKFKDPSHQSIIEKWDVREDSMLEALVDEFVGSKLDELEATTDEWNIYCEHGNSSQYALSSVVKNRIKAIGAPAVLRMYMEEPEKLFDK